MGCFSIKHGILVSNRPTPKLCINHQAAEIIIDGIMEEAEGPKEHPCFILFSRPPQRGRILLEQTHQLKHRRILGVTKRVHSAAFSLFPQEQEAATTEIIRCFIMYADKYCAIPRSKSTAARRRQLHQYATRITDLIMEALGSSLDSHFNRFSRILLDSRTNISYNMATNNCQNLVNHLLHGKDFEYMFPRLANGTPTDDWPQYLLSFGDCLEGVHQSSRQIYSLASLFARRKRGQCDFIDFIELLLSGRELVGSDSAHANDLWYLPRWQELLLLDHSQKAAQASPAQPNYLREVLWDLPRDTFSILQSHVLRPRHMHRTTQGKALNSAQWIANRRRLLAQLEIVTALTSSLGAELMAAFQRDEALVKRVIFPKARALGAVRADETVRIVRPTPLTAAYFILNRRSTEASWLLGARDDFFHKLTNAVLGNWGSLLRKIKNPDQDGSSALKALQKALMPIFEEYLRILVYTTKLLPSPVNPIGIDVLGIGISLGWRSVYSLFKQRLYGPDDWMVLTIGNTMTILLQQGKKSKNTRRSSKKIRRL